MFVGVVLFFNVVVEFVNSKDKSFMINVVEVGYVEIEVSKIVFEKSSNQVVKDYVQKMIDQYIMVDE